MKKRIFGLGMCILMLSAMLVPAYASDKVVAMIVTDPFGIAEGNAAIHPEKTEPDDEIIIPILQYSHFKDKEGNDIIWNEKEPDLGPTINQLRSNKIKPNIRIIKGEQVIRDYGFVEYETTRHVRARAALRVRFVEDFVSTAEVEYRFTISLMFEGKIVDFGFDRQYGGMMRNEIVDVYQKDYVNLSDGRVGHSFINTDNIRVEMGEGVFLYSDMLYDEKYYGVAHREGNKGQGLITKSYPQIDYVYEMKTVNLRQSGDIVEMTGYDTPYYVYNMYGEYVGTTDASRLPYSRLYYLSKHHIQIDVDQDALKRELFGQKTVLNPLEDFPSLAVNAFATGLSEG